MNELLEKYKYEIAILAIFIMLYLIYCVGVSILFEIIDYKRRAYTPIDFTSMKRAKLTEDHEEKISPTL